MYNTVNFNDKEVLPAKIACVGLNYLDHIEELGNKSPESPVIFVKPNSAIAKDVFSHKNDIIHYEGEISFLIRNGDIAGVGFGLDLTKREVQSELRKNGLPWEKAKAFDKSAVFSNFIAIDENDIAGLRMELCINNCLKQASGCSHMINSPLSLLRHINSFMTLTDNDILMSGTPSGVGEIHSGDELTGRLYNRERLLIETTWRVK